MYIGGISESIKTLFPLYREDEIRATYWDVETFL